MPDVEFIAVGQAHDVSYQQYLERQYFGLPNVEVTGFIDPFSDDTLSRILSRAWILVHPAAREGLPTAFQEASGHEVAILAFVDPGGYVSRFGWRLPDSASVADMEAALRATIETGDWREKGKAGRAYNLKYHATPISVERHMKVYQDHLARRSSS
jgi:glycosyltransferase involved in cell wall biosynthesis